mgnify:CR=1 FL=1
MGEIRPKKCEGRELTKDQLAKRRVASLRAVHKHNPATVQLIQEVATVKR